MAVYLGLADFICVTGRGQSPPITSVQKFGFTFLFSDLEKGKNKCVFSLQNMFLMFVYVQQLNCCGICFTSFDIHTTVVALMNLIILNSNWFPYYFAMCLCLFKY